MENPNRTPLVERAVRLAKEERRTVSVQCTGECRTWATVYRHQLTTAVVYYLKALYEEVGRDPAHVPSMPDNILGRRGSEGVGKLSCWGFTEKTCGYRGKNKTHAGWWRVTAAGEAFLEESIEVEEWALVAPYFKVHSNEAEAIVSVPDVVLLFGDLVDISSVPEGRFDPDKYITTDEELFDGR